MNTLRTVAFAGLMVCFSPLCRVATPRSLEGTRVDWKTGKSLQEARTIEDQRYKELVAQQDFRFRRIAAEWETEALACGNNAQTNSSCSKAAIQKRDRQLTLERQIRVRARTAHQDNTAAIERFWERARALKTP